MMEEIEDISSLGKKGSTPLKKGLPNQQQSDWVSLNCCLLTIL